MASQEFLQKIKKLGVRRLAECLTELTETSPGTWMGRCPNPEHKDAKASFMVKENDGIESWCCFGCHSGEKGGENFGSDNIAFVQWIYYHKFHQVLSFPQALQKVAKFYGIPMESGKFTMVYRKNKELMQRCEQQMTPFVKLYLAERGLDEADIQKWHLGFDGNRITFPIFNSVNEVIGFSNRAFSSEALKKQKYCNTPEKTRDGKETGFHKRSCLYGIQFVNPKDRRLFIFEGQMDAIIASKYGVPNAVAAMTCHLTDEQAKYIADHKFIPVVCFDPDDAGKKGAMKTMEILQEHGVKESRVLFLPDERDMADLGRDLKDKLLDAVMPRVMPFYQYILKELADEMDAAILEKQEEMMPKIRQAIDCVSGDDEKMIAEAFINKRILKMWAA